jgi:hypothetical protein
MMEITELQTPNIASANPAEVTQYKFAPTQTGLHTANLYEKGYERCHKGQREIG